MSNAGATSIMLHCIFLYSTTLHYVISMINRDQLGVFRMKMGRASGLGFLKLPGAKKLKQFLTKKLATRLE